MYVKSTDWSFFDRPQDYEELFNLRHAQARNVVERIFGVFKRRFALMEAAPEYSTKAQARFIPALAGIHNFIRIHDPSDRTLQRWRREEPTMRDTDSSTAAVEIREIQPEELGFEVTREERDRAAGHRDRIAKQMWDDYRRELQMRGLI